MAHFNADPFSEMFQADFDLYGQSEQPKPFEAPAEEPFEELRTSLLSYNDQAALAEQPTTISPQLLQIGSNSTEYLPTPELGNFNTPPGGYADMSANATPLFAPNNSFDNSQTALPNLFAGFDDTPAAPIQSAGPSYEAPLYAPDADYSTPLNVDVPAGPSYASIPDVGPSGIGMSRHVSGTTATSPRAPYVPAHKTGIAKKKGRKSNGPLKELDPEEPGISDVTRKQRKNTLAARQSRSRREERQQAAEDSAAHYKQKHAALVRYVKAAGIPIPAELDEEEEVEEGQ